MIRDWFGVALVAARVLYVCRRQSRFHLGNGSLDILQFQLILGRINLLGFGPEERLLKRGNQSLKPLILVLLRTDDRLQRGDVIG